MMFRFLLALLVFGISSHYLNAATHKLTGLVTDSTTVLNGASVSLLDPQDSTLAFFGISNEQGMFTLTDISEGSYVLQVAMMGYYTVYRKITVSAQNDDYLGVFVLAINHTGALLNEVVISGEKIPVSIKGDTLEYNAGSFNVKPDAAVEDLLRKLPGVEVDREGNIKANGKNVSKVTVDGKEFFGNDPKVATKNLPADAIDKVQSFESKSEETLFTGIDDGSREQTINLKLKEGHKTGYFGEARGGLGTAEKYDASLKAFKFRPKSQLAALGLLNNINKFGFSFNDYLNFNGGVKTLLQGNGRLELGPDDPVDMGQPRPGDFTSGAAGLNYSIEPFVKSQLGVHYLGNGARKLLEESSTSQNFTPTEMYYKNGQSQSKSDNLANRLAASWRSEIDSIHLLKINLSGQLTSNTSESVGKSSSTVQDRVINTLDSRNHDKGSNQNLSADVNWYTRLKGKWPVLEGDVNAAYKRSTSEERWNNLTSFDAPGQGFADNQYRTGDGRQLLAFGSLSAVRSLGNSFFLKPVVSVGIDRQSNKRVQGPLYNKNLVTDTLSPEIDRKVITFTPGLELKRNKKKIRWSIGLNTSAMWLAPTLNGTSLYSRNYNYALPFARWESDLSSGERLGLSYSTVVNAPEAINLLPVKDYSNPLSRMMGNPDLQPEYKHSVNIDYNKFDMFSMSSFYASLRGDYTVNKIGWNTLVQQDLSQDHIAMNTPYAVQATLSTQYSRPVKRIGLRIAAGFDESLSRSASAINGVTNVNTNWNHKLKLDVNNLNNDVFDIRWGASLTYSQASYSVNREMNNNYFNYSGYASIGYRPTSGWNFEVSCDLTRYTAQSFDAPVTIPLIKAEATRYILRNQRGAITLRGFDMLDKNKSVMRISQSNILAEQRANIIGRYLMLSFSYKLNKTGRKGNTDGLM